MCLMSVSELSPETRRERNRHMAAIGLSYELKRINVADADALQKLILDKWEFIAELAHQIHDNREPEKDV